MTDFRTRYYDRYVSTFKAGEGEGLRVEREQKIWWKHKIGPSLDGLASSAKILEIGCGSGRFLEFLAERGFKDARGIDISAEQVALARAAGRNVEVGDARTKLQGLESALDLIVAFDFVEHFRKEEVVELVDLLSRALAPGGRLILQTPNGAGLLPGAVIFGDFTHLTIFTPESLAQVLANSGFESLQFFETGPVAKNWRGWVRLRLWFLIRLLAGAVRMVECGRRQELWSENMICVARKPVCPPRQEGVVRNR